MILLLTLLWFTNPQPDEELLYAVVHTEAPHASKQVEGVRWWMETPDRLLVLTDKQGYAQLSRTEQVTRLEVPVRPENLRLVSRHHHHLPDDAFVLLSGGRFAVVQGRGLDHLPSHGHDIVMPFAPNTVLVKRMDRSLFKARGANPAIQALVDQVDGDRWFAAVEQLASYNRWTHGTEIHDARDWLVSQFEALPNLEVATQSFSVSGTEAFNVIARLPGTDQSNDFYIAGAHYDATSQIPNTQAPGAEDNASGTAAVLEMARIFSDEPPRADIYFICYSGEEQGLVGSTAHASGLVTAGTDKHCKMSLIMDMIGFTSDGTLESLLETNSSFSYFFDSFGQAAANYTTLDIATSLNPFGSDHMPYINRNIPSLLVIENDWGIYPDYHRSTDFPENLSIPMGRETIKMNVAVLAEVAGAAGAIPATLADYLVAWGEPVEAPVVDHFENGVVDILDILASNLL